MPTHPVRVVASLLACSVGLFAADDVTMEYTYDELAAGQDIHEGLYGSQGSGEFDEWRIHLGVSPSIDRVQVKSNSNGQAYPGPKFVETDKVINDPIMPRQIGLTWVMGDYASANEGWFVTLGLEYTWRTYSILYANGTDSSNLKVNSLAMHFGLGYAWYINPNLRYEIEPFVSPGMLWTTLEVRDPASEDVGLEAQGGAMFEAGLRNALIWHPAHTQAWHLGLSIDYRTGYGQVIYNDNTIAGPVHNEARFFWYGLCGALFYGHKF